MSKYFYKTFLKNWFAAANFDKKISSNQLYIESSESSYSSFELLQSCKGFLDKSSRIKMTQFPWI